MADYLGVRSVSTVHQHVEALRAKSYIARFGRTRSMRTGRANERPKLIQIPILGEIAAGLPLEPLEEPEPVLVSTQLAKNTKDYYALRVRGNSMIEDGIQDDDLVVIKSQSYVDSKGQTIVAITDGSATLKRFGGLASNGQVMLVPRNPRMDVIYADPATFEVRGILTGLIRGF